MERKQILKAYGAEMVFTDPGEGSDGAIRLCQRNLRGRSRPLLLSRISTTTPPTGRRTSTAPALEIMEQTERRDHALRRLHGHQRHVHGQLAPPASEEIPQRQVHLGAAVLRIPWPGRAEAHADRHRPRHLRLRRWPTTTSGSKPKTPTPCAAGWPAKRRCWWACRPARTWWPRFDVAQQAGRGRRDRRDRDHPVRRRRQISERTVLE